MVIEEAHDAPPTTVYNLHCAIDIVPCTRVGMFHRMIYGAATANELDYL